jgi:hypothetical protein
VGIRVAGRLPNTLWGEDGDPAFDDTKTEASKRIDELKRELGLE